MNARPALKVKKPPAAIESPKLLKGKMHNPEVEEYFQQKQKLRMSIENMTGSRGQGKRTQATTDKDGMVSPHVTNYGFISKQLISTDASSEAAIYPQAGSSLQSGSLIIKNSVSPSAQIQTPLLP